MKRRHFLRERKRSGRHDGRPRSKNSRYGSDRQRWYGGAPRSDLKHGGKQLARTRHNVNARDVQRGNPNETRRPPGPTRGRPGQSPARKNRVASDVFRGRRGERAPRRTRWAWPRGPPRAVKSAVQETRRAVGGARAVSRLATTRRSRFSRRRRDVRPGASRNTLFSYERRKTSTIVNSHLRLLFIICCFRCRTWKHVPRGISADGGTNNDVVPSGLFIYIWTDW